MSYFCCQQLYPQKPATNCLKNRAQTAAFQVASKTFFAANFPSFWGVLFIPRCERCFFPETNCVTLARFWRSEPIGIGSSCAWMSRDGSEAMDQKRLGSLGYNLNIPAFVGYKLGTTPPSQHFSQSLGWVFLEILSVHFGEKTHINLGPPSIFRVFVRWSGVETEPSSKKEAFLGTCCLFCTKSGDSGT